MRPIKRFIQQKMRILMGVLAMCAASGIHAQTAKAYAQLDTNEMLVGDRMTVSLRINFGSYEQITSNLPTDIVDTTEGFEIIDNGRWENVPLRDGQALERKVVFTVWDTGLYRISSFLIQIKTQLGDNYSIESPNCWLSVRHPDGVEGMAAPIGIKDIRVEPLELGDVLPYIFGVLIFVLVAIGVWRFWQWRKNRQIAVVVPTVVRPPHEIALEKWADLSPQNCQDEASIKHFYSELSYILREYVEKRFNIPALENTTDALMTLLDQYNQMDFTADTLAQLGECLRAADLVKFAKVVPALDKQTAWHQFVYDFIIQTQPKIAVGVENQVDNNE